MILFIILFTVLYSECLQANSFFKNTQKTTPNTFLFHRIKAGVAKPLSFFGHILVHLKFVNAVFLRSMVTPLLKGYISVH